MILQMCFFPISLPDMAEEFALRLVDLIGPAAAHVRLPARDSQRMGHELVFGKDQRFSEKKGIK